MRVTVIARFKNDNFRQARIAAGFRYQKDLERETGIPQSTISTYENFCGYPKQLDIIILLEEALKCNIEDVFPKEYKDAVDKKYGRPIEKTFDILALPDHNQFMLPDPAEIYDIEETREKLEKGLEVALKTLTNRESKVLKMRFGVGDRGHEHTLEEVANKFCVTRERIRQIEAKALRKLKHPSRGKSLKDFI